MLRTLRWNYNNISNWHLQRGAKQSQTKLPAYFSQTHKGKIDIDLRPCEWESKNLRAAKMVMPSLITEPRQFTPQTKYVELLMGVGAAAAGCCSRHLGPQYVESAFAREKSLRVRKWCWLCYPAVDEWKGRNVWCSAERERKHTQNMEPQNHLKTNDRRLSFSSLEHFSYLSAHAEHTKRKQK